MNRRRSATAPVLVSQVAAAGAHGFIDKSVEAGALLAAIRAVYTEQLVFPARLRVREAEQDAIADLVRAIEARPLERLDAALRADFEQAGDDAGRRRVVIDQVASLTDASAVSRHRRLVGPTAT